MSVRTKDPKIETRTIQFSTEKELFDHEGDRTLD